MNDNDDGAHDETEPFRSSGAGILALLDAPETDDGVVAEARFYGDAGCDELIKAIRSDDLDDGQRARAIHLLGWLDCEDLIQIIDKALEHGPLSVQVSAARALARIDHQTATAKLLPIIDNEAADSRLQEHAVHVLWPQADAETRQAIAKAVTSSHDERLRDELEHLIADEPPPQPHEPDPTANSNTCTTGRGPANDTGIPPL